MSWEPRENATSLGDDNGSLFVKLGDGDSIEGVFVDSPREFYVKWEVVGGKNTKIESDEPQDGYKWRFKSNFAQLVNGEVKMRIFEGGAMIYDALSGLNSAGYELGQTVVKVSRKGLKLNTDYTTLPLPVMLSESQLDSIAAAKRHSLESEVGL